jgi:hypothetical protein
MRKGTKHTIETKNKMSKKRIKLLENGMIPPMFGKKHSEEAKNKMKGKRPCISGRFHPMWRGGKIKTRGYIQIYCPEHPHCDHHGYVMEHRLVIEEKIGRYLTPKEVVHHIDENKQNNNIDNLKIFDNCGYHLNYHLGRGIYE